LIYLDASVVLAQLLAEDRRPADDLWTEPLVASRLLLYEVWNRIHSRGLGREHGDAAQAALNGVSVVELTPLVLRHALDPFPVPVRTLDALHLATMLFLRDQGQAVELASYDERLVAAGRALGIPLRSL
jgi:predicted nucleic acid-binding protein